MSDPWWQAAFGSDYSTLYAHRSDAQAAAEVAGVLPRLRAAGRVLDACCGAGRHLQALRAAGVPVFGFDYSDALLAEGWRQRPVLRGRVLRADMRRLPLAGGWGAITLFFTAFGYFDDQTNAAVLRGFAELLAADGWLMLDLPQVARLRAHLQPASEREVNGRRLLERRRLRGERVEKTVRIEMDGEVQREYTESVRLYEDHEIAALARASGCALAETWPSLQGPDIPGDRAVHWLRRVA